MSETELDTSSTDALHWAEMFCRMCEEQNITKIQPDFIASWFANYWAAVHDPLQAQVEELQNKLEKSQELKADTELGKKLLSVWMDHCSEDATSGDETLMADLDDGWLIYEAVQVLNSKLPWVLVSERLPPVDVDILFRHASGNHTVFMCDKDEGPEEKSELLKSGYTHWQLIADIPETHG